MAEESQVLHDFLMKGIHQAMADFGEAGMVDSDAVQAMMLGLAGTVAETMATLAMSFQPDDPTSASAFYKTFRGIVSRIMEEPEIVMAKPAPAPVRQVMIEPRGPDDPLLIRTVH